MAHGATKTPQMVLLPLFTFHIAFNIERIERIIFQIIQRNYHKGKGVLTEITKENDLQIQQNSPKLKNAENFLDNKY